ncbi:WAT1-related protein At4g08300 [Linum perenne]
MILVQISYTLLYFITEASFKRGFSPYVYVIYRHVVGTLVVFPFAFLLERTQRPKLTLSLFLEIFLLSLLGVGLPMNMYFLSLKYTSPTFIASMVNIIVPLTFAIAVVLRLESFDLRDPRGVAKVLGTLISLSGVMTMTIYKGPTVQQFWHPLIHEARLGKVATDDYHQNWLMGSVLMVTSCVIWSFWYIMQAFTLKRYPARLSLTTWMSALGTAQSAVFTVIVEREKAAWMIGFNIDLWSTIYGGVVISGFVIFIQLWCTDEKGPVFVTVFGPLTTILVAILAYFIVGENLYLGSIVGAAIVIVGLYLLLWGKEDDEKAEKMIKLDEETLPSNVDLTLKTPKATTANS